MSFLKDLMKREKKHALVLEILFVLYLLFNVNLPLPIANLIDTDIGKLVILLLAFTMFSASFIAGILALLVAFTLIKRSSGLLGGSLYNQNAEEIKMQVLNQYNETPETLEQEVISNMAPIIKTPGDQPSYKPVLNPVDGGAPINYEGVI